MKLTPITNPVALRLDTSVGTRIFSGSRMIYGDTGWRDIAALFPEFDPIPTEQGTRVGRFRRVGDYVTIIAQGYFYENPRGDTFGPDLRAIGAHPSISYQPSVGFWCYTSEYSLGNLSTDGYDWFLQARGIQLNRWVTVTAQYYTKSPWPTTLPGLPA